MKIAFINSVAGFGSTGKLVSTLSMMDEVDGKVYYGRKKDSSNAISMRFTGDIGNVTHAIGTYLFDDHGFHNAMETKRMLKDLDEFNPDIVHLHNLHGYYVHVGVLFDYLKRKNKKVIWTLHDCWSFTGHCAHYDGIGCDKWKSKCYDCPITNEYPFSWNKHNVTKNYERKKEVFTSIKDNLTIVTPSYWLEEQVKQSFLKECHVMTIHNGINLNDFKYTESSFREKYHLEDSFIVLAVASVWDMTKGIEDLKELANSLPENIKLVVVGGTLSSNTTTIENALCIPRTNTVKELCEIYSASDAFINLTKQDTFPTVNIEALACGLPVITYKTGGSPEILTEKTGIVVEKNNIEKMKEVLIELAKNNSFKIEDCIEVASHYSLDKMYESYLGLYKKVMV